MTKEEFMEYLTEGICGIFSTVREDGMPEARGWQFQYAEDDRYYFATANTKEVFAQLKAHPKAAFTVMEPLGKYTLRLTGDVGFVKDEEQKKAAWERMAAPVKGKYKSWDNPVFEIIYLENVEMKFEQGYKDTEKVL
ncbi:MAG: pyridoxamine 5'-phosphate oxidase family protein [Selenomonadaceae bacterium]|nr:pyridoxamine 5'-phosphate oxidase family protein [Selenomonadaceae bacterium]